MTALNAFLFKIATLLQPEFLEYNDITHMHKLLQSSSAMIVIDAFHFAQHCGPKYDMKMAKVKQNHTVNLNMDILGILWQLIHYFSGKQGLVFQSSMARSQM